MWAKLLFHAFCFILFKQADNKSTSNDKVANASIFDEKASDILCTVQSLNHMLTVIRMFMYLHYLNEILVSIHAICFIILIQADIQSNSKDKNANISTSDEKVSDILCNVERFVPCACIFIIKTEYCDAYITSGLQVKSQVENYLLCVVFILYAISLPWQLMSVLFFFFFFLKLSVILFFFLYNYPRL